MQLIVFEYAFLNMLELSKNSPKIRAKRSFLYSLVYQLTTRAIIIYCSCNYTFYLCGSNTFIFRLIRVLRRNSLKEMESIEIVFTTSVIFAVFAGLYHFPLLKPPQQL